MGICFSIAVSLSIPAVIFYNKNGVVRDIPELDVSLSNPLESQLYNGRINSFDKAFENNNKKNVLVIGDSYARDWVNVLLESGIASSLNISYHRVMDDEIKSRIDKATWVFIATCTPLSYEYSDLLPYLREKKWWRVGTKNFGSMGPIYNKRFDKDYFSQTVSVREEDKELNEKERLLYGKYYIDMMDTIRNRNGDIPAFTPSHKFISHDGLHLTKAGAKYYSQLINIRNMLK